MTLSNRSSTVVSHAAKQESAVSAGQLQTVALFTCTVGDSTASSVCSVGGIQRVLSGHFTLCQVLKGLPNPANRSVHKVSVSASLPHIYFLFACNCSTQLFALDKPVSLSIALSRLSLFIFFSSEKYHQERCLITLVSLHLKERFLGAEEMKVKNRNLKTFNYGQRILRTDHTLFKMLKVNGP